MKLDVLFDDLIDRERGRWPALEINGVTGDSRRVRPGYVFVALRGDHHDGRAFSGDAAARGAVAVVGAPGMKTPRDGVVVGHVPDAREALAQLAARFHGYPSEAMRVVGITGTNGKTTVAHLTRALLTAGGATCGLLGTVAYEIGRRAIPATRTTPEADTLQVLLASMRHAGCDAAVLEISSHALVQKRCAAVAYDVAVFTNLTRDHLDYHKTMEAYFEAKCLLFDGLASQRKAAVAVVNGDDPWGRRLGVRPIGVPVLVYGMEGKADVKAEHIRLDADGSRFRVASPWGSVDVALPMMGRFNVANALAALAAAGVSGVSLEGAADALGRANGAPGRMERIEAPRGSRVFVDYAHTDDALRNVLTTLREIEPRRIIVVFGCGGDRDRSKRPLMGQAAAELADTIVLTSDNPRTESPDAIVGEIRTGIPTSKSVRVLMDRGEAIREALSIAEPGDVVLIAGKGHEKFQAFANHIVPFDDCQVVRDILADMAEREGPGA